MRLLTAPICVLLRFRNSILRLPSVCRLSKGRGGDTKCKHQLSLSHIYLPDSSRKLLVALFFCILHMVFGVGPAYSKYSFTFYNGMGKGIDDSGRVYGIYNSTSYIATIRDGVKNLQVPSQGWLSTSVMACSQDGRVIGICYQVDNIGNSELCPNFVWFNGEYVLTPNDDPMPIVKAINNSGQAVGLYFGKQAQGFLQGFLYSNGVVSPFYDPARPNNFLDVRDINNLGQITGYDAGERDFTGTSYPAMPYFFIFEGGLFNYFTVPGSFQSVANRINNNGDVVGYYYKSASDHMNGNSSEDLRHGFIYSKGLFTYIDFPGATSTEPVAINDHGQVVGNYTLNGGEKHGFLYSEGVFSPIQFPSGYLVGINNSGQILGNDFNGSNTFLGSISSGKVNPKNDGYPSECVGNPVNIGTGNKFQEETDYVGGSAFPLVLQRYYNSSSQIPRSEIGSSWRQFYDRRLILVGSDTATMQRPDGRLLSYKLLNNIWVGDSDIVDRLQRTSSGWIYTTVNDGVEEYGSDGKLLSIKDRNGFTQTLTYSDGTSGANGGFILDASGNPTTRVLFSGKVIRIADAAGRSLNFGYLANGNIVKVTAPDNGSYLYQYDTRNNLVSVTYPDGYTKKYLYAEDAYTSVSNLPSTLTGIVDENGARFATYRYDIQGRVYDEEHGPNMVGGPVDHFNLAYTADASGNPINTIVTDPLGTQRTYNFNTILGAVKMTGNSQPGGSGCGAASSNISYDPNGNVQTRTDFNNNLTTYNQYDLTRNLELSRTEAVGSPVERTITTDWHPTFRLPTKITEPGRETSYSYDDNTGNLLSRSIKDTVNGKTRSWSYSYTTTADNTLPNLLKTVDGPRTDVNDVTTYSYYPNGDLKSVINALNHETRITQYDPHGRPQTILDPNNIVTELRYWPRGWIKSRTVAGESSYYDYDNIGQLKKVTSPDGSFVTYDYDEAHRLTDIRDAQGNHIHYTLDNIGNRIKQDVYNNLENLVTTGSRKFDALNRLWMDIGALNQTTTFEYDANGNLKKIDGPLTTQNDVTIQSFDALNRLETSTDGLNGITRFKYDALNQLRAVTDPNNHQTSYSLNALGEQTQLISPDTGSTVNTHDAAGNILSGTDADNNIVSYVYDALNRVATIKHNGQIAYTFVYDQGSNALGKLSSITGGSSTTTWTYNSQGRIQSRVQQSGALSLSTSYEYNVSGQLIKLTYPSGKVVGYGYNNLGQIDSVDVNGQPVISAAKYQPFGPVASWKWGNQTPYVRSFDTDGRLFSYPLGVSNIRALGFDEDSRVKIQTETTPLANTEFDYDDLGRLKAWRPPNGYQGYDYDAVGNRKRLVLGANSYTNTIDPNSNRLKSVAGPAAKTYSYNNSGNRTGDGTNIFTYNPAQRLTGVTFPGGNQNYSINALGQRVKKSDGSTSINFVYDEPGKLLGEYNSSGQPIEETVYLGDQPIAVLR